MSSPETPDAVMPPLDIEEPTVSMFFIVNTSPFASQDGNAITLRQLKARIERETKTDPALRMEDLGRPDGIKVSGRGELHLGILNRRNPPRGLRDMRLAPRGHRAARRERAARSSRWRSL